MEMMRMDYHTFMESLKGIKPVPKNEYFMRPFSIGGKIVETHLVHGVTVRHPRNFRWSGADKRLVPKAGAEVWRWRVRILTDEGWMLMGHIGKAQSKEELPPVRLGDRVQLERLTLDSHTGGNSVRRSWASIPRLYDYKQDGSVDWRPNNFSRQLHGKVIRKGA